MSTLLFVEILRERDVQAHREFEQIYPKPGWVEHDPMEIWASQSSTLVEVLAKADISSDQI
ncbi:FGGY family carbohydrate kinase, partial [Salmonella enterica subsp. enterica serovar Lubbock]|nr:FGGY family carbohydrate kinase [Salmonella enterica subsp. enterica serovar Lubbock]